MAKRACVDACLCGITVWTTQERFFIASGAMWQPCLPIGLIETSLYGEKSPGGGKGREIRWMKHVEENRGRIVIRGEKGPGLPPSFVTREKRRKKKLSFNLAGNSIMR